MMIWIAAGILLSGLAIGGAMQAGPRILYAAGGIVGLVGMFIFGSLACFVTFASAQIGRPPDVWPFTLFILSVAIGFGGVIGSSLHRHATEESRKDPPTS